MFNTCICVANNGYMWEVFLLSALPQQRAFALQLLQSFFESALSVPQQPLPLLQKGFPSTADVLLSSALLVQVSHFLSQMSSKRV